MSEGDQQQEQQEQSPLQNLAQALTGIRKVQNLLELSYPDQEAAIAAQRHAGDLVWREIHRMQQQQGQQ
jgi:hypothetical protein